NRRMIVNQRKVWECQGGTYRTASVTEIDIPVVSRSGSTGDRTQHHARIQLVEAASRTAGPAARIQVRHSDFVRRTCRLVAVTCRAVADGLPTRERHGGLFGRELRAP